MRYDYCVVRFVPDTFKAEFVNVGLIVGNAELGEWKVRRVQNGERASRFRNGAPLTAVWAYIDDLNELAGDLADGDAPADGTFGTGWLAGEHRRLQNLVQLSAPLPVLADTVDEAMSKLWDQMVVDPDRQARASAQPTRSALLQAYLGAEVDQRLIHENYHARVGNQDERVDFVIGNGHVAQVAHAWTFRGQNLDRTVRNIKAWSWTLRDVRDRDGGIPSSPRTAGSPPSTAASRSRSCTTTPTRRKAGARST